MKRVLSSITSLALLGTVSTALANDFQVEVAASYAMLDDGYFDVKTFAVGGTYYLNRVSTRSGPLEEVGYLSKSSFIEAGFASVGGDGDDEIYTFGGRLVTDANFFVGGNYTSGDFMDLLGVEAGTYLSDNSSVHLVYARGEDESGIADLETDTIGGFYKNIMEQGDGTAIGIEASLIHTRPDFDNAKNVNTLGLDADFFLTRATHIGANFSYTPTSGFESKSYGLEFQSFVDPMIALGASFERVDPDEGEETDTISLWIKGRF